MRTTQRPPLAGESVKLAVGVVAPDADLRGVHQRLARRIVGPEARQQRVFRRDIEQDGDGTAGREFDLGSDPAIAVAGPQAIDVRAFTNRGRLGADAQKTDEGLAAEHRTPREADERIVRLDDHTLLVQRRQRERRSGHPVRLCRRGAMLRPPIVHFHARMSIRSGYTNC
jgi:hypothetical protein